MKQGIIKRIQQKTGILINNVKWKLTSLKSLRWRLMFSYSMVTIGALLFVEVLLMTGLMFYFVKNIDLSPETLIKNLRQEWTPILQEYFTSDPPDVEGARLYLEEVQSTVISTEPLLVFGSLQIEMKVKDFLHFYILLKDRTLVDVVPRGIISEKDVGKKLPFDFFPGLSDPLHFAVQGFEDENMLYRVINPGKRVVGAIPVFRFDPVDTEFQHNIPDPILDIERNLVGIIVFTTKHFPWQFLPLADLAIYIWRSLMIFTLFAGFTGSLFGLWTANGLTLRLRNVSQAAHDWSLGDFSVSIRDKTDDEIGKLSNDLNLMAGQLESLMDRRQELSALEERNRLARDLHDSVKQQAFAAAAQIAAAKIHINDSPEKTSIHLEEADNLIEKVRQELTSLILELRPVEIKGKGLFSSVEDFVKDWKRRNEIGIDLERYGEYILPIDVEKTVFRIVQEALANVSWHSQASHVKVIFNYQLNGLQLTIKDNGKGFQYEKSSAEGMGLKFMSERAILIGGKLIINSVVDKGTEITLYCPYNTTG